MTLLVEPGIRNSFMESLKHCHEIKTNYRSVIFNIVLLVAFVAMTLGFLYYKYKNKSTPKDKKIKQDRDRMYILSRLKSLQLEKNHNINGLITDLPLHQFA